ncbi:MAG: DUF4097 and DUF4098 domain-containing protein YvlB [Halobacteriales archaeon]|jgi:DUF4097 and DUF4098 domain-containing protein YvlB
MRRRNLLAALTTTMGSIAGCVNLNLGQRRERPFERTVPVRDATAFSLLVTNGDVSVDGADRDDVGLSGTKWIRGDEGLLDRLRLQVEREDGHLTIDGNEEDFSKPVGIDVAATIPDDLPVREVVSVNGEIELSSVTGDALAVSSTNGEIVLESVDAAPEITTTNGDVRTGGLADLRSIETVNGDIDAALVGLTGDATIETTNGDVTARLGGIDARIQARTGNGEVSVAGLDVTVDSSGTKRLEGTIGNGGPTLRIETTNGDVTLRE